MRLHNLLAQPGGVAEQGREITLRLRVRGPGGVPTQRDLTVVLLPLSEVQMRRAAELARETAAQPGALPEGSELVIRVLQQSLRDPGDLGRPLVEDERDLAALRDGLVGVQYERLLQEYRALIDSEYPEHVSAADERDLAQQARDFLRGAQPSPG